MIDANAVGEIISLYEKHGWKLRRALLSPETRSSIEKKLANAEVSDADFDALWFSRRSSPDSEAWELRRLTGSPFALVTVVPTDATTDELEAALTQIEENLRERTIA